MILQNRGVFFFDPRHPQYAWNPRGAIDFLLFESFRLNSNSDEEWDPIHYPENRYNVGAQADGRGPRRRLPGAVTRLRRGPGRSHVEGDADGASMLGFDSLLEDIHVTEQLHGMRHYLTDSHRDRCVNDFVRAHGSLDDAGAAALVEHLQRSQPGYPNAARRTDAAGRHRQVVAGRGC